VTTDFRSDTFEIDGVCVVAGHEVSRAIFERVQLLLKIIDQHERTAAGSAEPSIERQREGAGS
jgi:hypothetical protein